jgi:hypothetical protein
MMCSYLKAKMRRHAQTREIQKDLLCIREDGPIGHTDVFISEQTGSQNQHQII